MEGNVARVARVIRVRGKQRHIVAIRDRGDQHVDGTTGDPMGPAQIEKFGGAIVVHWLDSEVGEVRERPL